MREFFSGLGALLAALIVAAVIVFGGWRLGWWFKQQDIGLQRDVNVNSQQYQDGLISQERDRVQAYDAAVDGAQKEQLKSTFCAVYLNIVQPPVDLSQANARICS